MGGGTGRAAGAALAIALLASGAAGAQSSMVTAAEDLFFDLSRAIVAAERCRDLGLSESFRAEYVVGDVAGEGIPSERRAQLADLAETDMRHKLDGEGCHGAAAMEALELYDRHVAPRLR